MTHGMRCFWLSSMSSAAQQDFALAFLGILFEGAPFILLGTLASGFIEVYLPKGVMDRFLPKNPVAAVFMAGLLGAILPVCECAVVPVIRRLVKKGLPVSCALTYMLAAPIVNPITALSTWKAFEGPHAWMMVMSRLILGYVVAVGVGLVVSRCKLSSILKAGVIPAEDQEEKAADCCEAGKCCQQEPSLREDRVVAAFRGALKDFVDVGVYFTIGVALTALFNTGIAPGVEWLDGLAKSQTLSPVALMALAFILSLCSTSDAFIAASLDKFSWGAKLAFLTFGPMLDLKLLFLYQTVLRKWFIALMAIGLLLSIWIASMFWQKLLFP